jgi:hypothetical protein
MQIGIGTPKAVRSQQSHPSKQLSGLTVQPSTRQECDWNVSQYVASVPAQSALEVQLMLRPLGGRLQYEGVAVVSQAYPPVQSPPVQPEVVQ